MTPAQASGHPNFVTDVPVQGPTDEGIRAADCWFAQNRLPAKPACVDCNGPVPEWARTSGVGDLMETISFGGNGALGFALGGPGDPDVFATLTAAQQTWVQASLLLLNSKIMAASGTSCPTWVDPGVNLKAAVGCFQLWYNVNYGTGQGSKALRTDGVVDADTLASIQMIASLHAADFNVPFPAAAGVPAKGLSTGAMVGIGVAGAAAVGGVIYTATRKSGKRRR
jgi:hypothetical protein